MLTQRLFIRPQFLTFVATMAWCSFSSADTLRVPGQYADIQACADAAKPGDTCLVGAGTYGGVSMSRSGNPGLRITLLADPAGAQPRITGTVQFGNHSYLTVDGFYMDRASFEGEDCSFVEIKNNVMDGQGIMKLSPCSDVLIDHNTFKNLTRDVTRQFGKRWVIRNNDATENIEDVDDVHLDFWQSYCVGGSEYADWPADFTLLENNTYTEVYGGNVHFQIFHQTTKCGSDQGTNFIFRHNKIRDIGSGAIGFDNDSGAPGFRGVASYNNSLVQTARGNHSQYQDYAAVYDSVATGTGFFINNILYDAMEPKDAKAIYPSYPAHCTLAYEPNATITTDGALQSSVASIINQDPLFNDLSSNDFSLSPGSPAINTGCSLTRVADSDSGSGTTLVVNDPWFFQPGWAGIKGDCIAVGTVSNMACITDIDYETGGLTLASGLARNPGDDVWLYSDSDGTRVLHGSAPEIGAVEFPEGLPPSDGGGPDAGGPDASTRVDATSVPDTSVPDTSVPDTSIAPDAVPDSGVPDSGGQGDDSTSGGCNCRITSEINPPFVALLVGLLLANRRRRRRA